MSKQTEIEILNDFIEKKIEYYRNLLRKLENDLLATRRENETVANSLNINLMTTLKPLIGQEKTDSIRNEVLIAMDEMTNKLRKTGEQIEIALAGDNWQYDLYNLTKDIG